MSGSSKSSRRPPGAQVLTLISALAVSGALHAENEPTETVTISADAMVTPAGGATPTTLVTRQDIAQAPGADRSNSLAMITD